MVADLNFKEYSKLVRAKKQTSDETAQKILDIVKKSLDDGKAEDISVIDLEGKSSIANYMVVASGTSNRHVASLAENLQLKLKEHGFKSISEGEEKADWILIDAYDVIIHIFKPEVRSFYSLEKMWSIARKDI
ncbi:MAG: ribosome silencing factor [Alphaproteobacteria bacterium]|nr:ribosome silencing factor [Alphaproteobacteria bacterium]